MNVLHLTASPNFGGPERQMLELARTLPKTKKVQFFIASFPEGGNAVPFLTESEKSGFPTYCFRNDMPHLFAAGQELFRYLKDNSIDILLAHGHKARMLGWLMCQRLNIPVIGVSRGWTGENRKIRFYERIDKWIHRRMDYVVCVSQGQADKVQHYGTPKNRIAVIHNAVRTERFNTPHPEYRQKLESLFQTPPRFILGDAGRLSPEKGFDVLINAVAALNGTSQYKQGTIGLVIFGSGFLQETLQEQIRNSGLTDTVKLAGFTGELDKYMPYFDVFVQASHTEGLPNVLLEAMAAKTAVIATDVGGTDEVVVDGETGLLIPPNDVDALTVAIERVLSDPTLRQRFGESGCRRVEEHFTFEAQAESYWNLFELVKNNQGHSARFTQSASP